MAIFSLPLPTALNSGEGGATNTLISAQSSIQLDPNNQNGAILISSNNKTVLYSDPEQRTRIGGIYPSQNKLSITDPNGACLELVYNESNSIRSSLSVNSMGDLILSTYSNKLLLPNTVRISGHNGTNAGLILGSDLVKATALQLNYVTTTPGVAQASKALVVDEFRKINNIAELTSSSIYGELRTGHQPDINSVNILNILNHNGSSSGLSLNGTLITASAEQINYLKVPQGTAWPSKALVLDSNRSINDINRLSAISLSGIIETPSQPNITSIGTLNNLLVSGSVRINKSVPDGFAFSVNHSQGNCIRLNYIDASITQFATFSLSSNGSLQLNMSGPEILIAGGKKIKFLESGEIIGLETINATSISGTITTEFQPNIKYVGPLGVLTVDGSVGIGMSALQTTRKMEINDVNGNCLRLYNNYQQIPSNIKFADFVVNTNGELNITTTGSFVNIINSTLRFIGTGEIIGVSSLSATTLTGTLQTSSQPNITRVGVLNNLTLSGPISGVTVLTATTISGTLQTASQPNITSVGTLNGLTLSGPVSGVTDLTAVTVTGTLQTASQPNITRVGVLNSLTLSGPISGVTALTATTISGTLQTASQLNITSVGVLNSLTVSGNITTNATVTADKLSGTIQTENQPNIKKVGTLNDLNVNGTVFASNMISAVSLQGTLITSAQPNITSLGALTSLVVNGTLTGVTSLTATSITGTLLTPAQPNISTVGILQNLRTTEPIGISTSNPAKMVEINDPNGNCLRLSHNAFSGNAVTFCDFSVSNSGNLTISPSGSSVIIPDSKNIVLSSGNISGVSALTASSITGTLLTANQSNITSVGRLTQLYVDTFLGINCSGTQTQQVQVYGTEGKCLKIARKENTEYYCTFDISSTGDLLIDTNGGGINLPQSTVLTIPQGTIDGLSSLTASSLTGTIVTSTQNNITSVGTLSNLRVDGSVGINSSTGSYGLYVKKNNGSCLHMSNSDATGSNYVTFIVTLDGKLRIDTSGSDILFGDNTNLSFSGQTSSISGLNSLTSTSITGTLLTPTQTNITSVGTLTSLTTNGRVGINKSNPARQLEINDPNGNCIRMSNNASFSGSATSFCDLSVNANGELIISPSGNTVSYSSDTNMVLSGDSTFSAPKAYFGNTERRTMPLEVGVVPFLMTEAYAFNNNLNGHGTIRAGASSVYNYSIRTNGRILCTGSVDVTSDQRLKKNIQPLDEQYCKEFVQTTRPIMFQWNSGETHTMFGYVAQELIKTGFGDLVNLAEEEGMEEDVDDDGFVSPENVKFTVSYENIIPILAMNQRTIIEENHMLKKELQELRELVMSMRS